MTKEYRARYTIIAQMLDIVNDSGIEGITKTSIMYKAFLSYAQLREYPSLMNANYVVPDARSLKCSIYGIIGLPICPRISPLGFCSV
jgi:predicted transcriptional regulator